MTSRTESTLEEERARLRAEFSAREAELNQIIAALTDRVQAFEGSTSWRVTRPLRGLRRILSRLRRIAPDPSDLQRRREVRRHRNRLQRSGLFDPGHYARTYPDVAEARVDPLTHYVTVGAPEGRTPHPLFDPAFYQKQLAQPADQPLLHYLQAGGRDGLSPHPLFDGAFYLRSNPDVLDAGVDPLTHYVTRGARDGRDPHPLFDTPTYLRVHPDAASDPTPLTHFIRHGAVPTAGAYTSIDDLVAQQRRFLGQVDVRVLADRRTTPSPWAVLLQCGSTSRHRRWLTGAPRPWHLIVNHYDETFAGTMPAEVETRQPGTKFSAVYILRTRCPEVLRGYRYVLLLDDDLLVSEQGLTTLFRTAESNGLDLAQPALAASSPGNWPVLRARPGGAIRRVNAVEIMMPLLSSRALENGIHVFSQTISGWGLDFALGKITADAFGGSAAVVDSVVVEHLSPIDTQDGPYYRFLQSIGISPRVELRVLQRLYRTDRDFCEVASSESRPQAEGDGA